MVVRTEMLADSRCVFMYLLDPTAALIFIKQYKQQIPQFCIFKYV